MEECKITEPIFISVTHASRSLQTAMKVTRGLILCYCKSEYPWGYSAATACDRSCSACRVKVPSKVLQLTVATAVLWYETYIAEQEKSGCACIITQGAFLFRDGYHPRKRTFKCKTQPKHVFSKYEIHPKWPRGNNLQVVIVGRPNKPKFPRYKNPVHLK